MMIHLRMNNLINNLMNPIQIVQSADAFRGQCFIQKAGLCDIFLTKTKLYSGLFHQHLPQPGKALHQDAGDGQRHARATQAQRGGARSRQTWRQQHGAEAGEDKAARRKPHHGRTSRHHARHHPPKA